MLQYFLCFQIQFATIHRYYDKHIQMINDYRFTQDSIMSLDISFSRVSRCLPNSSSGQWRSLMKVCKASSFQKRSSEVPEPLLQGQMSEFSILKTRKRENNAFFFYSLLRWTFAQQVPCSLWRLHAHSAELKQDYKLQCK